MTVLNSAPAGELVCEVRLGRASAPRCVRFRRLIRWRWDVTVSEPTDPVHTGVYDGRSHLYGKHGYTITRIGSALRLARVVVKSREVDA